MAIPTLKHKDSALRLTPHYLVVLLLLVFAAACSNDNSIVPDDISGINEATIEAETGLSGVSEDDLTYLSGVSTTTETINLKAGILIIEATSDGGLFSVNLVQETGNELLFNEVTKFSGSAAIKIRDLSGPSRGIQPGSATLEVISSRDWTITYTQEDIGATHR